jgi:hypothetical protein
MLPVLWRKSMTKVIERERISKGIKKPVAAHLEGVVLHEAKQVAQGLIKLPDVLQVARFGKVKNKQGGYNLHLLIEVADVNLYKRFVQILKRNTEKNKTEWRRSYSDSALRLMALSSVWDVHTPEWRTFFALDGGDIHIDVCVVSQNYREKLHRLKDDIPHHNPDFIRSFGVAEVLASKRFEV